MNIINNLTPNALDKIICVKIGKYTRENLYEMARKYWKVKLEKASYATHVLAVEKNIVVAVYIPERWYYTENEHYQGRCEFVGKEDESSGYIGKNVADFYGKSQNPVKYINF